MVKDDNRPTLLRALERVETTSPGEFRLLVMIGESAQSHRIGQEGRIVLGRSSDADIQVSDSTISRRHAALNIGSRFRVEDLGSLNGTRLRGKKLDPGESLEFTLGEVIEIGDAMVVLQRKVGPHKPLEILAHARFQDRLREVFEQATRRKTALAVVVIQVDRGVPLADFENALGLSLRPGDGIVGRQDQEYAVLLPSATAIMAESLVRQLGRSLGRFQAEVRIGWAAYPQDVQTAEQLLEKARAQTHTDATSELAGPWVFEDPSMQALIRMIERLAPSGTSLIVQGETGVGKEVIARMIHAHSRRPPDQFISVNCAALPDSLLESELFGHERGAFTGAVHSKPGLLEVARKGTFLLDEVSELPLGLQAKLLRVLEERKAVRVGGVKPYRIEARFVATSNRNLEEAVMQGGFRQDLFFRLNGATLLVPPLRERLADIEPLAKMFLRTIHRQLGRPGKPTLTREAVAWLQSYPWPGNVRELRNVVERAVLLATDSKIGPELFTTGAFRPRRSTRTGGPEHEPVAAAASLLSEAARTESQDDDTEWDQGTDIKPPLDGERPLRREVDDLEQKRILQALEASGGNQTEAARKLGISRRTLINRLEKFKIKRPRKDRTR